MGFIEELPFLKETTPEEIPPGIYHMAAARTVEAFCEAIGGALEIITANDCLSFFNKLWIRYINSGNVLKGAFDDRIMILSHMILMHSKNIINKIINWTNILHYG